MMISIQELSPVIATTRQNHENQNTKLFLFVGGGEEGLSNHFHVSTQQGKSD